VYISDFNQNLVLVAEPCRLLTNTAVTSAVTKLASKISTFLDDWESQRR